MTRTDLISIVDDDEERTVKTRKPVQVEKEKTVPEGAPAVHPEYSDVAALAYQLWNDRGCPIGSPEEDWLRAETELQQDHKAVGAAA